MIRDVSTGKTYPDTISYLRRNDKPIKSPTNAHRTTKSEPAGLANVHISLAAIINPKETSPSETYEIQSIVRRLSARIAARVVIFIQQRGAVEVSDLAALREEIVKEANRVFSSGFSKWAHAEDYEVQFVVTSLFLTDGSVGRTPGSARGWRAW